MHKSGHNFHIISTWEIFTPYGKRKYLTKLEIDKFLTASRSKGIETQSFCYMLALTGCRISEALALTSDCIDFDAKTVIIRSLKKRGRCAFRAVPLPPPLLALLTKIVANTDDCGAFLWPWSRMTGYRRICDIMRSAGIIGSFANPKGLRHGFGVHAIQSQIPINLVQRLLGHADIKTTAIYTNAIGPEELSIAARMW